MRIVPVLLLVLPLAANAGVYKCVNAAGKTTYSGKPCRGNESHAGMDVKGMTYSSDEVMYSNERAASIMQNERQALQIEEATTVLPQPGGATSHDDAEKTKARERARQAERELARRRGKASSAGIQNGGTPWVPAAGGAVDPKTGEFKVDAAGGHIDATTGKFVPVPGK